MQTAAVETRCTRSGGSPKVPIISASASSSSSPSSSPSSSLSGSSPSSGSSLGVLLSSSPSSPIGVDEGVGCMQ
jgi:hypothetical protein